MNKTKLFLLAALIASTTPFFASADIVSDLREQLQSVLNQIESLKSELVLVESGITTTPGSGGSCVTINKNLSKGNDNSEVRKLQLFLAQDSTVYPEGITSGYFGSLTEKAVQRWQTRRGVISYGTAASTGYGAVGPKTRAAIAAACGNSGTVEGTDNIVAFTFTNNSGQAPFKAQTKLTMLESACMSYEIDWGDGSPTTKHTSLQSTNCGGGVGSVTENHTYSLAGTYAATLYAGKGNVNTLPQVTLANVTILAGEPFVKILSPNGGETLKLGDNTTLKWQVANQPQDSAVVFYIAGPSGTYRFAKRSHRAQEFDWIVGDRVCDGNGCNVQLPLGSNYKIRAVLYTPADACIDFCDDQSVLPKFLVNDESDTSFSLAQLGASSGTTPLTIKDSTGKAPFTASMNVKLAPVSGGVGNFEVDFGDGSTPFRIHVPVGETRTTERTLSHTYANIGDYYVRLRPVGAIQHISEERVTVSESDFRVMPKNKSVAPVTAKAMFKIDTACNHDKDITRIYTINWGDNTDTSRFEQRSNKCTDANAPSQTLADKSFTHIYTDAGSYNPELTVAVGNAYHKQVLNVSVDRINLSVSPTFGFKPLITKARFTADESCVMGNATTATYSIDWGDGTAKSESTKSLPSCGGTFTLTTVDKEFSHTYQEIGRYTITLTVRKGNIGSSATKTKEVVVDKTVLMSGWHKLVYGLNQLTAGASMAAVAQVVTGK